MEIAFSSPNSLQQQDPTSNSFQETEVVVCLVATSTGFARGGANNISPFLAAHVSKMMGKSSSFEHPKRLPTENELH